MTRLAELPDGTVLEFPDDTPDEVIVRSARRILGVGEHGSTKATPAPSTSRSAPKAAPAWIDSTLAKAFSGASAMTGAVTQRLGVKGSNPNAMLESVRAMLPETLNRGPVNKAMETPGFANMVARDIATTAPPLVRAIPRGATPAAAGAAGFSFGFETTPSPHVAGKFIGGALGGLTASFLAGKLQEGALDAMPESITVPLGQDAATREADYRDHPYATMVGESLPGFLFGRPGKVDRLPSVGSSMGRMVTSPAGQVGIASTISGTVEAGRELATQGEIDPARVAIAAGIGALQTKNTRLGDMAMTAGAKGANWTAGLFGARRATFDRMTGDFEANFGDNAEFSAERPPAPPAGGFRDFEHSDGSELLSANDGAQPVKFRNHREAARYAVDNELGGAYDIAVKDGGLVLQRRAGAPADSRAPVGDPEAPVSGELPAVTAEAAALDGVLPAAPAATAQPAVPVAVAPTVQTGIEAVSGSAGDSALKASADGFRAQIENEARNLPGEELPSTAGLQRVEQIAAVKQGAGDGLPIDTLAKAHIERLISETQAGRFDPSLEPVIEDVARRIAVADGAPSVTRLHAAEAASYVHQYRLGQAIPKDNAPMLDAEPGALPAQAGEAPAMDAAAADPAAKLADRADTSGITGADKGGYSPAFKEASFTDRPSVYQSAIRATGIPEDTFRLLPPKIQTRKLAEAVTTLTGIEMTIDPAMSLYTANNQMLDAHQTLQGMAHVLGISPKALSLDGTLKLKLLKSGKFLGAYSPKDAQILLPGRSNSFAHEWSHALDFHLLRQVKRQSGTGLSGLVRRQGADFKPATVADAFVGVLNAMFFDKTDMAAKIMDLESQIAASRSAKRKAELRAQIDRFAKGNSQAQKIRSQYYRNAQTVDGNSGREYWTSPTEMMARAFEAYVSSRAAAQGLGTEFIGKGDTSYQSMADERFAKTFPKAGERQAIFEALDTLMEKLGGAKMLERGSGVRPDEGETVRATDFLKHEDMPDDGGLIAAEIASFKHEVAQMAAARESRGKRGKSTAQAARDVQTTATDLMGSRMRMFAKRHKSKSIMAAAEKLDYEPGSGKHTKENYFEEVESARNKNFNALANVLKKHNLVRMTIAQQDMLRRALTAMEGEEVMLAALPKFIREAATSIRILLDAELQRNLDVGLPVGYTRESGYLKRMLDVGRVFNDPRAFIEAATEAYAAQFDRDHGKDASEVIAREGGVEAFVAAAKASGTAVPRGISKLEGDELLTAIDNLFDVTRDAYARAAAEAWLSRIQTARVDDLGAHLPQGSYAKSRSLPPEADRILAEFYVQNPLEAVMSYFDQSARRVAFARRFGPNGEGLKTLADNMAAEDVSVDDQKEVLKIISIATGRHDYQVGRSSGVALSFVMAYTTLRLLPRSVLASLPESLTAGITASDWRQGFKALSTSVVGTRSLNGKQRHELARAIGIVTDIGADTINMERFGHSFADDPKFAWLAQRMFENIGLTALTRRQRTHTLAASHAFLDNMARHTISGDRAAIDMLSELGVSDPETWAKEMADRDAMPSVDELQTKWGAEYALASRRFVDMTIASPNPMTRPQLASHPVGRLVYGITAFSTTAWKNLYKRRLKMAAKSYRDAGGGAAGAAMGAWDILTFLPGWLTLFMGASIISVLREYLLNPQRWEELDKKGELETTQFKIALSRSVNLGMLDPAVQAYTGLKYQRDLSGAMVGPGVGAMLAGAQKVLEAVSRDSAKTNTAEFNRDKAIYDSVVGPAFSAALSFAPGGPLIRGLAGFGQAAVTSPRAGSMVAEAIEGPKGSKTDPKSGKVVGPPKTSKPSARKEWWGG